MSNERYILSHPKQCILALVIYIVLPYDYFITELFGMSIILFIIFNSWATLKEIPFGLEININNKAKYWIYVGTGLFTFIFITGIILIAIMTNAQPDSQMSTYEMSRFERLGIPETWLPNNNIYEALNNRDPISLIKELYFTFLGVVIVIPLIETILLIGLLGITVKNRFGKRWALVILPVIFLLSHFDVIPTLSSIPTLLLGFIMIYLFLRTNSIYPPILIHAVGNLLVLTILVLYNYGLSPVSN